MIAGGAFGPTRPTRSLGGQRWALVPRHGAVALLLMTEQGPRAVPLLHDPVSGALLAYNVGDFITVLAADLHAAYAVREEDAEEDPDLAAEWAVAGMPALLGRHSTEVGGV